MSHVRGIEHVGITVPDHANAVAFLKAAFGAEEILSQTDAHGGPFTAQDVGRMNGLRAGTRMMHVSILRLRNGANIEVFEIDRPGGTSETNISDLGISHISINVDDVDAVADAFTDAGGTLLSKPYDLGPPEDGPGNRGVFGRTPWGLLIEMQQFASSLDYLPGASSGRWFPKP
ncbi:VOC family protein [Psychromarinibacter sp. S121]|uniref:VOC family protein n=1 Tax=Psychromarinibacter sp. S121 TaxID=3415127 RepID=UPI003C7B0A1B